MAQTPLVGRPDMKHAGTVRMHEFWTDLRAGRDAPFRSEITDRGIGETLAAHAFILEAVSLPGAAGRDLRFRLAGSLLAGLFGMDLRGMSALSLMAGDNRDRMADVAEECLTDGEIGVVEGVAIDGAGGEIAFELILAPIRSDFGRLDRLLGAIHILGAAEGAAIRPAPRRCRLTHVGRYSTSGDGKTAGPLPGFAEPTAGFAHKPAEGPERPKGRTLRLVKK